MVTWWIVTFLPCASIRVLSLVTQDHPGFSHAFCCNESLSELLCKCCLFISGCSTGNRGTMYICTCTVNVQ